MTNPNVADREVLREISPVPSWCALAPFERPADRRAALVEGGVVTWLVDAQCKVEGASEAWLYRRVEEVATADGLQTASVLDVPYSPETEEVEIHAVRLEREGVVRNVFDPRALQALRRERDLERGIYDGEVTLHHVVPGIRIGDVVETIVSFRRSNLALGGHFAAAVRLQFVTPVGEARFRFLSERGRDLEFCMRPNTPAPFVGAAGDYDLQDWRIVEPPPLKFPSQAPEWWVPWMGGLIGDRMTWAQVADVFRGGYEDCGALPAGVEAAVEEIARTHPDVPDRVAAALRHVQSNTRYLATNAGDGGYVPRPLEEIDARRSGDCKDVSRLLAAMIRRLGASAAPALVDTSADPELASRPPFLKAFNHCLVRAEVQGQIYWLDPTNAPQAGRLDALTQPRLGWALPLVENAVLEPMGEDAAPALLAVAETWTFGEKPSSPADLSIVSSFSGWRADELRRWIGNSGAHAVEESFRSAVERPYGETLSRAPIAIQDDEDRNTITTTESYEVLKPWSIDGEFAVFSTVDDVFGPQCDLGDEVRRNAPIDLGRPRRAVYERKLLLPISTHTDCWDDAFSGPGVRARALAEAPDPRRFRLRLEYAVSRAFVPASEAAEYLAFRKAVRGSPGATLRLPVFGDSFAPGSTSKRQGLIIAVLLAIALYLLLRFFNG
jgi:hypothetical protein